MTLTDFTQRITITKFSNEVILRNGTKGIRLIRIDRLVYDSYFEEHGMRDALLGSLYDYFFVV